MEIAQASHVADETTLTGTAWTGTPSWLEGCTGASFRLRVGRHLSLMEASFVLWRLPPFPANGASRLIESPSLFVGDSGLPAHLM